MQGLITIPSTFNKLVYSVQTFACNPDKSRSLLVRQVVVAMTGFVAAFACFNVKMPLLLISEIKSGGRSDLSPKSRILSLLI